MTQPCRLGLEDGEQIGDVLDAVDPPRLGLERRGALVVRSTPVLVISLVSRRPARQDRDVAGTSPCTAPPR